MSKKSIVKLLMNRDNISEQEAQDWVDEVQDLINEVIENTTESSFEGYCEIEEILRTELGLEPDYMIDFLF